MTNNSNFFDINNYTETKNPILSAIFRELQNSTDLGKVSGDVSKIKEQNANIDNKFYETLNKEQKELYTDLYLCECDEHTQAETECFNIGFKLGIRLMMEVFG